MKNNILIIVAHPDDEILWMWWTIKKMINNGNNISVLLLSKPWNARNNNESEIRLSNFKDVMYKLWINNLYYENFPDTSFDSLRLLDIIKKIEKIIELVKPDIVYTHFYNDLNIDHSITSKAVITALRPIKKFNFVKKIFLFEILSSTELSIWNDIFKPNYYENIEDSIDFKKDLMTIYSSELKFFPHPRSLNWIEILAKYRWMESWFEFAEAFMLYREIN